MSAENPVRCTVSEDRIGKVRNWGEMSSFISPDDIKEHENFLRGYFKAQIFLQSGNRVKAKKIFNGLDKATGYLEFEKENSDLLRAIDLAVEGESRW